MHRRPVISVRALGLLLGWPLLGGLVPSTAAAQRSTPVASPPVDPTPVAPFADPDTTRNIAGHVTFTRYTTAGQCLGAIFSTQRELVRSPGRDTLFGPVSMTDPFPVPVREIGERCRVQVASTPVAPRELQNVFVLATLLYDTAGGDAARERWLAAPQTLEDRGQTPAEMRAKRIDSAIKSYVYSELAGPMRTPYGTRAYSLFAQLDGMGQPVRNQRLAMQEHLLAVAQDQWTVQETGRIRDPQQDLHDWLAFLAGIDSVGGWARAGEYGASGMIATSRLLDARIVLDRTSMVRFADSVVKALPKLQMAGPLLMLMAHSSMTGIGDTVPRLHGTFWYNARGDTLWPNPGQFSLLLYDDLSAGEAAFVRRLVARYGPKGLRMLVVVKTKGYWNRSGTETGPRTAAQEAAQDSAYYLGYRKLPTALAVQEAHFRQEPNGWWMQDQPVQYERDWEKIGGSTYRMALVDSTGKLFVRLPIEDAVANALIDQIMGRK
jgi:hypothetical protein